MATSHQHDCGYIGCDWVPCVLQCVRMKPHDVSAVCHADTRSYTPNVATNVTEKCKP